MCLPSETRRSQTLTPGSPPPVRCRDGRLSTGGGGLSNVERGHGGGRVRLVSCQIKPEAHFVKRRHVAGFRPTIFIDFAKVAKEAYSRERFRRSLVRRRS